MTTTTTTIEITPSAAIKVRELLEESGKIDHALRIFVRGMSCSGPAYGMALDNEPRDDDSVTEFEGVRILVDPLSAQYVEGAQVDYVDGLMGRGFTVSNPNTRPKLAAAAGAVATAPAAATDPYRILQVAPNADLEAIHAAYRRLARRYHPDLNPQPEAAERMRAINGAYGLLSDPARRAVYDARRYFPRSQ